MYQGLTLPGLSPIQLPNYKPKQYTWGTIKKQHFCKCEDIRLFQINQSANSSALSGFYASADSLELTHIKKIFSTTYCGSEKKLVCLGFIDSHEFISQIIGQFEETGIVNGLWSPTPEPEHSTQLLERIQLCLSMYYDPNLSKLQQKLHQCFVIYYYDSLNIAVSSTFMEGTNYQTNPFNSFKKQKNLICIHKMNKRREKGYLFIWVIWLDYEIMHFYGGLPIDKVSDSGITFQKIDNSVVCSHINKSGKLSTQIIGEKNNKSVNPGKYYPNSYLYSFQSVKQSLQFFIAVLMEINELSAPTFVKAQDYKTKEGQHYLYCEYGPNQLDKFKEKCVKLRIEADFQKIQSYAISSHWSISFIKFEYDPSTFIISYNHMNMPKFNIVTNFILIISTSKNNIPEIQGILNENEIRSKSQLGKTGEVVIQLDSIEQTIKGSRVLIENGYRRISFLNKSEFASLTAYQV